MVAKISPRACPKFQNWSAIRITFQALVLYLTFSNLAALKDPSVLAALPRRNPYSLPFRQSQTRNPLLTMLRRDYIRRDFGSRNSYPLQRTASMAVLDYLKSVNNDHRWENKLNKDYTKSRAGNFGNKKGPCPFSKGRDKGSDPKSGCPGNGPKPCPGTGSKSHRSNGKKPCPQKNKNQPKPGPSGCPNGGKKPCPSKQGTVVPRPQPPPKKPCPKSNGKDKPCEDKHEFCCFWASLGHCDLNMYWMRPNCQKACGTCGCTRSNADKCPVKLGYCGSQQPVTPPPAPITTQAPALPISTSTPATTNPPATPPPPPPPQTSPNLPPTPLPPVYVPTTTSFYQPPGTDRGSCVDTHELCCFWATNGECDLNAFYMRIYCQKACGTCGCTYESAPTCHVNLGSCSDGYVTPKPSTPGQTSPPATKSPVEPYPGGTCKDKHDLCCFWASLGHCDSNLHWMRPNCQKSCGTCGCQANHAESCHVTGSECVLPSPTQSSPAPFVTVATSALPATTTNTAPPAVTDTATVPPAPPPVTVPEAPKGECKDTNELCCFWASIGHCDLNLYWMRPYCQKSCGTCGCTVESADSCATRIAPFCRVTTGSDLTPAPAPQPPDGHQPTTEHGELPLPPAPPSPLKIDVPPPAPVQPPAPPSPLKVDVPPPAPAQPPTPTSATVNAPTAPPTAPPTTPSTTPPTTNTAPPQPPPKTAGPPGIPSIPPEGGYGSLPDGGGFENYMSLAEYESIQNEKKSGGDEEDPKEGSRLTDSSDT